MFATEKRPPILKTAVIAVRPFALPASSMPVLFGTASAVLIGDARFNPLLFILALVAMIILHSAANLLSDVNDFRKGLDREPTPASGAIVRGYITARSGIIGSAVLFSAGVGIGTVIVFRVGWPILLIGSIGVAVGASYTLKPLAFKYRALGDLAVFLNFGTLGALGAWTVQSGQPSWVPALWSIPMSMLVVAILHANNWRDIRGDSDRDIRTLASILGDRGSNIYFNILVMGSYGVILFLILFTRVINDFKPKMPLTFLITFTTIPFAVKLIQKGKRRNIPSRQREFQSLDAGTSLLSLVFGLLSTTALLLHYLVQRYLT
jgi:1,4-dihydroxy-2-naphthoate octaprenyltransferase